MHSISYNDKNLSHVQQLSIYQIFRIKFFIFSAPNKKKLLYKIMIFLMPWVFFLSFKICFFFHLKIHVRNITFEVRQKTQTLSVQNQWSNRKPDYYFSLISGFCWPALFRELYIFFGEGGGISWFCLNSTYTAAVIGKKGFF